MHVESNRKKWMKNNNNIKNYVVAAAADADAMGVFVGTHPVCCVQIKMN